METKFKSAVEELFDIDSGEYLSKHLTPEHAREKSRMLALLDRGEQLERILDIGCGPGTMSEDLLSISNEVWGIDISKEMISIANRQFASSAVADRVHFDVGNAERLGFDDEYFDTVVCAGVLRYLGSWEKGVQEVYRVLKPKGVVVATFYYRFSPHWFSMYFCYRPLLPLISLARRRSVNESFLKYKAEPLPFSYRQFRKSFSECGFKDVVVQHSGFDIFPINRLLPRLSRSVYLKAESSLFDSNWAGWLGSICIIKGVK